MMINFVGVCLVSAQLYCPVNFGRQMNLELLMLAAITNDHVFDRVQAAAHCRCQGNSCSS